jgi:hypothetical protein
MPDITISVKIPSEKVEDFKEAFLTLNPPPEDWGGTELEWIRRWTRERLIEAYKMGKLHEARKAIPDGTDTIIE